jgi:serine/threonine protein kinase
LFVIKQIPIAEDFEKGKFEETIEGWKKSCKLSSHIVGYYDHWYENDYVYIVMEYCENGDLNQEIKRRSKNNIKFSEKVNFLFLYNLKYINI